MTRFVEQFFSGSASPADVLANAAEVKTPPHVAEIAVDRDAPDPANCRCTDCTALRGPANLPRDKWLGGHPCDWPVAINGIPAEKCCATSTNCQCLAGSYPTRNINDWHLCRDFRAIPSVARMFEEARVASLATSARHRQERKFRQITYAASKRQAAATA